MEPASISFVLLLAVLLLAGDVLVSARGDLLDPVKWMERADRELGILNSEYSLFTWDVTVGVEPSVEFSLNETMSEWKRARCLEARSLANVPPLVSRAVFYLCRGPVYIGPVEGAVFTLQMKLRELYNSKKLCEASGACYHIEPELEKLMRRSRDPSVLQWAWEGWRRITAKEGMDLYPVFIQAQNIGANDNGYDDIGECWREELEVDNLEQVVEELLLEIAPFHRLLHAFVRHRLRIYYGPMQVSADGPIPAHLLGNMWSQSWESLLDILLNTTLDLNTALQKKYTNVTEMVLEAEKYYTSIGLEPMTEKFWKNSVITKISPNVSCHGTAANMFIEDDYRMIMCGSLTWEDFYVIHHEMGHIQYYMAYKNLPTVFKEAANSAFQEAIGDTIMLAVETPTHLKRLGIVASDEDIEIPLLLYQALKKIPHIPFGFVVDRWRWDVMASNITEEEYNKAWWQYRTTLEGIKPPTPREPGSFDPISKFHIPDNTPYIRYFLSEFLQFQFLEVLCELKAKRFEIRDQQLHLCDLHGFEEAGKKLKVMMSYGSMRKWPYILEEFSNGKYNKMSAQPILDYFQPLINWLEEQISIHNIPVGW